MRQITRVSNLGGEMRPTDRDDAQPCVISADFCGSKSLCSGISETRESIRNNPERLHTQDKM